MNTPRSVLFALLSLGFLAISANAQNTDATKLAARPGDGDRLYEEARDFYRKSKYREAQAIMIRAYATFQRLEIKDKSTHANYLRILCQISLQLKENDKAIDYAYALTKHALSEGDKVFGYKTLGQSYNTKGEHGKSIGYYQKALAIIRKGKDIDKLESEIPTIDPSINKNSKDIPTSPSTYLERQFIEREKDSPERDEVSISGKDLYEVSYIFSDFYLNDYSSGNLQNELMKINNNINYLYDRINLLSNINGKYDIEPDTEIHQVSLKLNKYFSKYFDVGIVMDLAYVEAPDASLTIYNQNDYVKFEVKTNGHKLSVSPFVKLRKNFFQNTKAKFNVYSALEIDLSYSTVLGNYEVSSNIAQGITLEKWNRNIKDIREFEEGEPISWSPEYDFKSTNFNLSPSLDFGVEIWLNTICLNPSLSFEKMFSNQDNYIWKKSLGIHKVIGLYDSIFIRYSWAEDKVYNLDEFQLGVSITR